jgi:hypothetical protein
MNNLKSSFVPKLINLLSDRVNECFKDDRYQESLQENIQLCRFQDTLLHDLLKLIAGRINDKIEVVKIALDSCISNYFSASLGRSLKIDELFYAIQELIAKNFIFPLIGRVVAQTSKRDFPIVKDLPFAATLVEDESVAERRRELNKWLNEQKYASDELQKLKL